MYTYWNHQLVGAFRSPDVPKPQICQTTFFFYRFLPGMEVTTRMQHPVSSPINRMPGSDFKKNFFFKALLAEGPEWPGCCQDANQFRKTSRMLSGCCQDAVGYDQKWKLEKLYESKGIKPKLCSYRPVGGKSTLAHLFAFSDRRRELDKL